jgi:hypothetical protein
MLAAIFDRTFIYDGLRRQLSLNHTRAIPLFLHDIKRLHPSCWQGFAGTFVAL